MFESIGQVLTLGPVSADHTIRRAWRTPQRTGQPVRRNSQLAGRCEGMFWHPTARQDVRKIVLAARRYDVHGRQPGRRNGPLGHVALEILDLMANLVSYKTGRLDPSLDYLMRKLRRSKSAIVDALAALRIHGFLDWLRRYEPTGEEGRGPRVKQTSNAYRLSMPKRALALLGRLGMQPPEPDDYSLTREQRDAERLAYAKSLPLDQFALFEVDDPDLANALARLARSMQERESSKQSESRAIKI